MANDGDMHFPPGQRRDKPSFEPPPWEQDQFDELAKRRQATEPATSVEEADAPAPETGPVASGPRGSVPELGEAAQAQPESSAVEEEPENSELDPKQVDMLMMGLRSEEPRLDDTYSKITIAVGAASALIGLVLTTWGVVGIAAPKRGGVAPVFLVGVPLLFGIGFVAGGVWVVFRSLRQQGVL